MRYFSRQNAGILFCAFLLRAKCYSVTTQEPPSFVSFFGTCWIFLWVWFTKEPWLVSKFIVSSVLLPQTTIKSSKVVVPYHKWFLSKNLLLRRWLEFTESEIKTRLGSNKTNCKRRRRRRTIEFIHFYIFSFEYKSYHESLLKLVVIIILEDALFFTPQAVWAS